MMLRFGPTITYSDLCGEWEEIKHHVLDSLPLKNVEVKTSALLTIPELPLLFEKFGYVGDTIMHILVCRCESIEHYRNSIKASITTWWRDRLESSHEWFLVVINESNSNGEQSNCDEVMKKIGEDFYSRTAGDRSCTLDQVIKGNWHSTFQPYIEKALSSKSQQYDDEISSIVDAEFVLNKVFCLHDSFACLAESLGLWKEALLQYNECLKTIEQNQKLSTELPIHENYGLLERSPFEMRQMAKDNKELNYGEVIHYIFLRKAQLLFVLNRPSEVLQGGFQMVLLTLEEHQHTIASKKWAVMACWDIMQKFREKFGHIEFKKGTAPPPPSTFDSPPQLRSRGPSLPQPPKLDHIESSVIALHVTNLLCCLHRCFLDVAAITPTLKLSYVWSIRRIDRTSQLIWKKTSPLLKKELPKRPRRPPPSVPGSSIPASPTAAVNSDTASDSPSTTFSEPSVSLLLSKEFQFKESGSEMRDPNPFYDVDLSQGYVEGPNQGSWISRALSDVACFEKSYLKVLQLLCGYYNISRRKRVALVFARELIELAWHREEFHRLVDMLSAGQAPSYSWQALQHQSHYAALCHRQLGDLKSYMLEVLSLIDQDDGSYGGRKGNFMMESFRIYDHYSFLIQDLEKISNRNKFGSAMNQDSGSENGCFMFDYVMTNAFKVKKIKIFDRPDLKQKEEAEIVRKASSDTLKWQNLAVFSPEMKKKSTVSINVPSRGETQMARAEQGDKVKGQIRLTKNFMGCSNIKLSSMELRFRSNSESFDENGRSWTTKSMNNDLENETCNKWNFDEADEILIPFFLDCDKVGSFSLVNITLVWGPARLHLAIDNIEPISIEVKERPNKPKLDMFYPEIVSYHTQTSVSFVITNYEYEPFEGSLSLKQSQGFSFGTEAQLVEPDDTVSTVNKKTPFLSIETLKEKEDYDAAVNVYSHKVNFQVDARQTVEIKVPISIDALLDDDLAISPNNNGLSLLSIFASVSLGTQGIPSTAQVSFPCCELISFASSSKSLACIKKDNAKEYRWMIGFQLQKVPKRQLKDLLSNNHLFEGDEGATEIARLLNSNDFDSKLEKEESDDQIIGIENTNFVGENSASTKMDKFRNEIRIELDEYEVKLQDPMQLVEDPNIFDDCELDKAISLSFCVKSPVQQGKLSLMLKYEAQVARKSTCGRERNGNRDNAEASQVSTVVCQCVKTIKVQLDQNADLVGMNREVISVKYGKPLLVIFKFTSHMSRSVNQNQNQYASTSSSFIKFQLNDLDPTVWMCGSSTKGSTKLLSLDKEQQDHQTSKESMENKASIFHGKVSFLLLPLKLGEIKLPSLTLLDMNNQDQSQYYDIHNNIQCKFVFVEAPSQAVAVITNMEC